MNLLEETKYLMKKYKIHANKSLGQNFLIDSNVIANITSCSQINKNDLIIEIGPGLGSMTEKLLEKAKKVICIELDKKMIKILNDRFIAYNNIELINANVLELNLQDIINQEKEKNSFSSIKIVANLPYYITTPIIMKLLEDNLEIDSITVMVQKEVAERLIEIPGGKNTGAITYTVYYYCESNKIMEVENSSFIPMPEVTSEIINLKIRKHPIIEVKNKEVFFRIIKYSFMQRRKTLVNSLTNAGIFRTKEEAISIFKKIGLSDNIRAEKLSIFDFANLANIFCETLKK